MSERLDRSIIGCNWTNGSPAPLTFPFLGCGVPTWGVSPGMRENITSNEKWRVGKGNRRAFRYGNGRGSVETAVETGPRNFLRAPCSEN